MENDKYEDLGMIDNTAIVERVWTYQEELSTVIYFDHNCLYIGHLKIPVEYIVRIYTHGENVIMDTCIEIIGNMVMKADKVTYIHVEFVCSIDANAFRTTAYNCMIDCKSSGVFDHSIFSLRAVREIFYRKIVS
jgi:hypothetical protein